MATKMLVEADQRLRAVTLILKNTSNNLTESGYIVSALIANNDKNT